MLTLCLLLLPEPLTPELGHRDWRRRESATRALAALGPLARPALERAASHPDPEVRRRAGLLLLPWEEERLWERAGRVCPRLPWLAIYWGQDRYLALARRRCGKEEGAPDWPEYRLATRLWVCDQLRQRRPLAEIVEALDRMAVEGDAWRRTHPEPVGAPTGPE